MIVMQIALGLLGLGVVVFVHELGHFVAARLVGIDVEAFSIGWGNPILKKTFRGVEYRLGMFPMGGYCKMRGHDDLKGALETGADGMKPAKGSFYAAGPLRRILVCLAGPLFNFAFALVVFSTIWGAGREFYTAESRIVLYSETRPGAVFPADEAGMKSGDRIVEINGRRIEFFRDIVENVMRADASRPLSVTVERDGETVGLSVTPVIDRDTGAGRIGVTEWTDPTIAGIVPDGDAAVAGLRPGDRIVRVNGVEVANTVGFNMALREGPTIATVDFVRDGVEGSVPLLLTQAGARPGIEWPRTRMETPRLSPPAAVATGARVTWETLTESVRGLALLFSGRVNPTQAVAGPVRITQMLGGAATAGFERGAEAAGVGGGIAVGARVMAEFLAFISVILGMMNLLPLPVLDGGQIVLYAVETVRRKPAHPKALQVFQTVGVVLVGGLMIFALFSDILFLGGRAGGG